jgi:hypothetical protein
MAKKKEYMSLATLSSPSISVILYIISKEKIELDLEDFGRKGIQNIQP